MSPPDSRPQATIQIIEDGDELSVYVRIPEQHKDSSAGRLAMAAANAINKLMAEQLPDVPNVITTRVH